MILLKFGVRSDQGFETGCPKAQQIQKIPRVVQLFVLICLCVKIVLPSLNFLTSSNYVRVRLLQLVKHLPAISQPWFGSLAPRHAWVLWTTEYRPASSPSPPKNKISIILHTRGRGKDFTQSQLSSPSHSLFFLKLVKVVVCLSLDMLDFLLWICNF